MMNILARFSPSAMGGWIAAGEAKCLLDEMRQEIGQAKARSTVGICDHAPTRREFLEDATIFMALALHHRYHALKAGCSTWV